MFVHTIFAMFACSAAVLASRVHHPPHYYTGGQAQMACINPNIAATETSCTCPKDRNNDKGVLINYFPGYQCAYPAGACSWTTSGVLQNTAQTNCPTNAPCGQNGCSCPVDKTGNKGVLINELTGYQCAYAGGACTWGFDGNLVNTAQTNCPKKVPVCHRQ